MVTITKKEFRQRGLSEDSLFCEFHLTHPDQEAVMDSCPNCFFIEDPCGCGLDEECEECAETTGDVK